MSETENEEAAEISRFASTALRAPRKGTFEQLLSQHLILSVTAKPLKKIRLITEAAMMVDPNKLKNQEELKNVYRVARAFQSASYTKIDQWGTHIWFIPWDFASSKENFDTFIKPFHIYTSYFKQYIKYHRQTAWKLKHRRMFGGCGHVLAIAKKGEVKETIKRLFATFEECPKCHWGLEAKEIAKEETTIVTENPLWSFFFEMSRNCLSEPGFKMLRNAFINYALPKVQKAVRALSELVTPQQYQEMLKLLTKQGEEKAEVSLGPIE